LRTRILLITMAISLGGLWTGDANAQARAGMRAGLSVDPDQFYFGGHVETAPLVERVSFRPNVEVGIGDNLTLLAINVEFVAGFPVRGRPWRVYLGGGPAANIYSWSEGHGQGDGSDAGGGLNLLAGFEHRDGLFVEIKVGALDSPSLRFAVGYNFKR